MDSTGRRRRRQSDGTTVEEDRVSSVKNQKNKNSVKNPNHEQTSRKPSGPPHEKSHENRIKKTKQNSGPKPTSGKKRKRKIGAFLFFCGHVFSFHFEVVAKETLSQQLVDGR